MLFYTHNVRVFDWFRDQAFLSNLLICRNKYIKVKLKVDPIGPSINWVYTGSTYHIITAAGVPDAEPDVALVVDGGGVGELVRLEVDERGRLAHAVLELTHDLSVNRTAGKKSGRHS